jgi:hypothetical protein
MRATCPAHLILLVRLPTIFKYRLNNSLVIPDRDSYTKSVLESVWLWQAYLTTFQQLILLLSLREWGSLWTTYRIDMASFKNLQSRRPFKTVCALKKPEGW